MPSGLYARLCNAFLVIIICCIFIHGCKRRIVSMQKSDKLGFRVGDCGSVRVSRVGLGSELWFRLMLGLAVR